MLFLFLYLLGVNSELFTGGYNLFIWSGSSSCSGSPTTSMGISSGYPLTFASCSAIEDYGLDTRTNPTGSFWVDQNGTTYNLYVSSGPKCQKQSVQYTFTGNFEDCVCGDAGSFDGCISVRVPTWSVSFPPNDRCEGGEVVTGLWKNLCVSLNGTGPFMLRAWRCYDSRKCYSSVLHELVTGCNTDCTDCRNWWLVSPTDCKCADDLCMLVDFSNGSENPVGGFYFFTRVFFVLVWFLLVQ
eukprot:TRINITY_DN8536_c0_g2_i5.p1 TRINITY_DN8536_c0_g2~~TRINITY_DN8536_c0_g2_i5.p1  ORF type:complete len:241 (-),score=29.95 TRINITY_DN8536_c0_g2_i5:80-802(-)